MASHYGGARTLVQVSWYPGAVVTGARELSGKFRNTQARIQVAHEKMAADAAQEVRNALEKELKAHGRAQLREGAEGLPGIITAPGNRHADADGFQVGLDSFMNSSQAGTYWRNLEYGSDVFVGRVLFGAFRNGGSWFGPDPARYLHDPRLLQFVPTIGHPFEERHDRASAPGDTSRGYRTRMVAGGRNPQGHNRVMEETPGSRLRGPSQYVMSSEQTDREGRQYRQDRPVIPYDSLRRGAARSSNTSGVAGPVDRRHEVYTPNHPTVQAHPELASSFLARRGRGGYQIRIQRPIPAYRYFEQGFTNWRRNSNYKQQYAEAFQPVIEAMARIGRGRTP